MARVLRTKEMSKCIGCFTCMNVCAAINHKSHSLHKSSIHIKTAGGISGKFVAEVCHACRDAACAEVCPTGALGLRKGGGVVLSEELCIGCGRCKDACAAFAIGFDQDSKKPIICKHCGACVQFCPHKCIAMEEVPN